MKVYIRVIYIILWVGCLLTFSEHLYLWALSSHTQVQMLFNWLHSLVFLQLLAEPTRTQSLHLKLSAINTS